MTKTFKNFAMGVLVGALLMVSTFAVASTVNQYVLIKADYPIYVDGEIYDSNLPILNYQGSTYAPLRAISELLNVKIIWNDELNRVEITPGLPPIENSAFRKIAVTGSQGTYTVTGEARIFEATYQYEVSDGHQVFMKGFGTASSGAPDWGTFTINVNIAPSKLPVNGTVTIFLFEESAKDGSVVNELAFALEIFPGQ